jgi:hypothetical protein
MTLIQLYGKYDASSFVNLNALFNRLEITSYSTSIHFNNVRYSPWSVLLHFSYSYTISEPKKVANEVSVHAISIAIGPLSSALPPLEQYPCIPRPPRFRSLKAGINSNESSTQYLLMI